MKSILRLKRTLLGFFPLVLFLLTSCGPKIIPDEVEERIDREISFEEVKRDPQSYMGKRILVGGEIIETRNLKERTEIEILQKPLGSDRGPLFVDESKGRFLVVHPSFLDPTVFRSGRRITVVGVVEGSRSQNVGETAMVYPVLQDEHLHLWPLDSGRRNEPNFGISLGFGAIFGR